MAHAPVVRLTHRVSEGSEIICLAKGKVFSAPPTKDTTPGRKWPDGQLLNPTPPKKQKVANPDE